MSILKSSRIELVGASGDCTIQSTPKSEERIAAPARRITAWLGFLLVRHVVGDGAIYAFSLRPLSCASRPVDLERRLRVDLTHSPRRREWPLCADIVEKADSLRSITFLRAVGTLREIELPVRPGKRPSSQRSRQSIREPINRRKRPSMRNRAIFGGAIFRYLRTAAVRIAFTAEPR